MFLQDVRGRVSANNQFLNDKGERVDYDFCGSKVLRLAQKWYDENLKDAKAVHIGSSYVTYYNGTRNEWDRLHHFFKKVSK